MNTDLRTLVAAAVALALLLCVGGIVYLAAVPERPVPDVLVALSTGALGYLGGLLVPTTTPRRRSERGYVSEGVGVIALGLLAALAGLLADLSLLVWLGLIIVVVGIVLLALRR